MTWLAGMAGAAAPPPGTPIPNTANATFQTGAGSSAAAPSNTVTALVGTLDAFKLTQAQNVSLTAGSAFVLAHPLANTGNVAASITLGLTASGTLAPAGLALVVDLNGNGVADPGEPVLGVGGQVSVAAGATVNLLVTGTVPASATTGSTAQLRLLATDGANPAGASVVDTITVGGAAAVSVAKSASTGAPVQGGPLVYTITALNAGGAAAAALPVTIDGAAATLFVLRDVVPANTTYAASSSATPGAQLLYHRAGDPPDSYLSTPPAPAPDAVAWALPDLAAGASLVGKLGVTVDANAAGTLGNIAYAEFSSAGVPTSVPSNAVALVLPALAPSVGFYTSASYSAPLYQTARGAPLFVQFNAAQCNTDGSKILTHAITLVSQRTGDTESFIATETAANSGVFRVLPDVPTADAAVRPPVSGDGVLEMLRDDVVTATLSGCGSAVASANIVVDPSSIVFDSKTNAPIAGASVQLLAVTGSGNGGSNGSPATVYGPDGVTPAPSSATTAGDGSFAFPLVAPGTYRLQVTSPSGYIFPSKVPVNQLPSGRTIDASGSYGGVFTISGGSRPVAVDVPLDSASAPPGGLFLQKNANKVEAQVGDFVDYAISVSNNSAAALSSATLVDALPMGFAYVRGSARWNGTVLPDPAGGAGPSLIFTLGNVALATASTLTYRVRVQPGAPMGNNVNVAQATSGTLRSNQASATVKITGQVLADNDKAYLFGKVYADCNGNRIQDGDEPGLPGVRIYLDNGTYAITDGEGKYSIYGLTPRTYVAKLDTTTLPDGAVLEILDNRNAGDAGSQFVDMQFGELHKTDFALKRCTPALDEEIAARRRKADKTPAEIQQAASSRIALTQISTGDARGLPAAGLFGQGAGSAPGAGGPAKSNAAGAVPAEGATPPAPEAGTPAPGASGAAPDGGTPAPSAPASLASLLPTLGPQAAFVDLLDEQLLPSDQIRVRVQGPYGTRLRLGVNEHDIGDARVGEKSCLESRRVCAWEYVGVQLSPGRNVLRLAAVDPFGIVRGTSMIHVTAPGKLARIVISGPAQANADVPAPVSYTVHLTDEHGVPVIARTILTLDATLGQWQATDIDPKEPGIQVAVEGGTGQFDLRAPEHPGKATLRIHSGDVHGEFELTFVPNLRPLIAAGLVEGALKFGSIHAQNLLPIQSGDSFEQQIQGMSYAMDNQRDSVGAHASLFLKGKISGSDLLTMSYDSDKPGDTNLFRDIQPDRFYPVYGDSSIKGFDAQATSKLYVRVDRGTSYVLYGDYSTQSDNPARLLTQYNRLLNGARTHVENGPLALDGFMSYTSSVQVVDEIPANGTSGPYELSRRNGVINSQRVEIVTRDRNQPSLVLSDVVLSQFTDYAIEPLLGQILFKAPVPSLDANLNPIYIRVTYELDSGGPSYWVAGIDLRERIAEGYTAGAVEIRDTNPLNRDTLRGVNLMCTRFTNTTVIAELAQSRTDLAGTGDARRIEVRHNDPRLQAKVYAVQTDADFNNPNSTFNSGAAEFGAKVAYTLDPQDRLLVDALRSTTSGTTVPDISSLPLSTLPSMIPGGGMREGASVGIEHTLDKDLKITGSLRHFDANEVPTQALAAGGVPTSYDSARVRLDAPIPGVTRASAFAQYDVAIDGSGRAAATVGANYQLAPQTRIYATHETSDSLSGDYALSPTQQNYLTVVGIDTTYMHDGQLFNEYRVGDAIDGRSAEAAVGLRNLWHLAPGLGLSTTVQRIHPISGTVNNEATALSGALEYTAPKDWKGSTKLEWSDSASAQTWLGSIGVAARLDPSLTALARSLYSRQNGSAAAGSMRLDLEQFGLALRPVNSDVWNALARVEHKRNRNGTLGPGLNVDESADILSAHLNVQPAADWVIDGRYGIKRAIDYLNAFPTYYTAQIAGARAVWDINDRWDAGLQYYIEKGAGDGSARQQAYGFEVGYLLVKNSWLSVGYNVRGINDPDLAGGDYTQRAFYLRVRVKFDENLFKPRNNAQALPAEAMVP